MPIHTPETVEGNDFDFRSLRYIRAKNGFTDYDHNFCLSNERTDKRHVTTAFSRKSGVELNVLSGEPRVQFYSGGGIRFSVVGLNGKKYGAGAGFCLETQIWPDAPNNPTYPNALLDVGNVRIQETDYVFSKK